MSKVPLVGSFLSNTRALNAASDTLRVARTFVVYDLPDQPDSLASLVTNLSVNKCATAEAAYKECIEYAISTPNLPNAFMYLYAIHANWLGWSANIGKFTLTPDLRLKFAVSPRSLQTTTRGALLLAQVTQDDPLEDAFVCIKPGGERDGTSNTSATRYDVHCGLADAIQPAPEPVLGSKMPKRCHNVGTFTLNLTSSV
ncbi:hypothetical protein EG329_013175 [Mollisiaceae sp. DMI_Dod_QoI]|nr:hypothetical protein EG329_013175 [Helotiales sp. DMI_Dod_QoI]